MIDEQLELSFGNERAVFPGTVSQRRLERAHGWFDRMRRLVDRAMDRQPAPEPPPEQIWFAGSHREVGQAARIDLAARPVSREERQGLRIS